MTSMRLDDYLRKIGVDGPLLPTVDTLRRLHSAHRQTFLFENLSIQRGGRISLSLDDLERKFLDDGCGGYCFEHNTLFGGALRELGFTFASLLARVRRGPPAGWMRTHMVLRVIVSNEPWLADVGFGGFGLIEPIPLAAGRPVHQGGATYVLRFDAFRQPSGRSLEDEARGGRLNRDGVWVLSMRDRSTTTDLYEFTEDPQTAGDIEVANHYTSTHPASMFRRTLTIQRTTASERLVLRTGAIVRFRDGVATEQPVERAHLRTTVRDLFGIELPETLVCELESDDVRA
jgi:N-hydroxyarylamine O-acetyltransferase